MLAALAAICGFVVGFLAGGRSTTSRPDVVELSLGPDVLEGGDGEVRPLSERPPVPDSTRLPGVADEAGEPASVRAPTGGLARALSLPHASLRQAELVGVGYALAERDLEGALRSLEALELREERDAFLKGVFSLAASVHGIAETFRLAAGLRDGDRATALLAALDTLTDSRPETQERARSFSERFGVEAGVALALSLDPVYQPEHAQAWIDVFGDTHSSGMVIGSLASLRADDEFEKALAMGDALTDWDREMFLRAFGDGWSQRSPEEAWSWARQHSLEAGPGSDPILATVLKNWGRKDFAAAEAAFATLRDPGQRRLAAHSLAQVQTWDHGTAAAVHWAEGLPTEAERDAAHAAIAEFSPQGIGVALMQEDGYAVIRNVIPESAAARDGRLQQGDRIVEVDPGTGRFQVIYGRELTQALDLIRGDSGSSLRLRVVRPDADGILRDRVVELTREQIVLGGG